MIRFASDEAGSLRLRFYVDFESERKRYEELLDICEFLSIRYLTSGSIITSIPPYRMVAVIILRHKMILDEPWEGISAWCADNECAVDENEEPLLLLRMRDVATDEIAEWLKQQNITCSVNSYSIIDADTFNPIILVEYVFRSPADAVLFKLRWSEFLGPPSPRSKTA